ncbi:MAG TPA: L,D-transpeptidase [Longimicrobiaceae bacterium]|nr:L,D-transpeptidase [Longimicrobiaceae bacterium]
MDERTTRAGGPERRNHTPPGRLRRIFFDYRGVTLALLGGAALLAVLFVTATAWAVNERYERDVAKIAYAHDMQSLAFLQEQEARSAAAIADSVRQLEAKESELLPSERPYLVVSIAERKVSYIKGDDTLFAAPVAVGSGKTLVLGGRTKRFQTPRGKMSITHKELDPVWVPPNWHYVEVARKRGLRVVDMSNAPPNALAGFPAGREPIRGNTIYIPPWGSPQRKHKGVLGVAKLEMYDGYYFHGTDNEASIGTAASHGCIRMRKDDILWMYENVPVGTQVYIY